MAHPRKFCAPAGLIVALLFAAAARADDAAYLSPPSFRQDVLPVLTRYGCNSGACHGKLAGQNGFKLSLRAYAPEMDHPWLTTDLHSRRIDYAFPEQSLLLRKATGQVPHEGGKRFEAGSPAYRVLADWIAARTPGPDRSESDAVRVELSPAAQSVKPGQKLALKAIAHYPGGRTRDVTWLAQFFSNDPATATVTPDGVVTCVRAGEAAVRAHFQGQVGVAVFTAPFETTTISPDQYAAKTNVIDEHVFAKLAALKIPPSPACDDATFLRRAALDATGTLPTPGQVRSFLADTDSAKRARLVDRLLDSPEFVDYWTLQLCDLLQNRKERDHDVRGAKGVRAFQAWVRRQVAANRPWNELAREVLTAKGDAVSSPQVGYFITVIGEKDNVGESEVADSVAQSFLGTRIGCARCHNHPLEKYTQDDYYHFAACFARVSLQRVEPAKGTTVLLTMTRDQRQRQRELDRRQKELAEAEKALAGKTGDELEKAKKSVEEKRKRVEEQRKQVDEAASRPAAIDQPRTHQPMAPQPLDRAKFETQPGQDPRELLAAWMTDAKNEQFSGAMVNRLWRHFMGVGLVEPVDDLRSSNPPSNPALFAALNREFVAHGYDLKHVMRLILNSRAYQLSSETLDGNEADRRFHSHYYARRLPAEVMLDAVSAATDVPDRFPGYPVGTRAAQLPEPGVGSYFLTLFGRSDRVTACACERNGEVTLPQLLHLSNGDDVQQKIRSGEGRLAALLAAKADDTKLMQDIFLATVSRPPTKHEAEAVAKVIAGGDPKEDVYRDLFWALLNSKEFAFNH
jgi:hypothetical protein